MKISAGKIILLTLHIAFLLPVFWEDGIIGMLATIVVFIALIYGNFSSKTVISNTNSFLPILVVIGGISTYFLSVQLGLGSVIAASIVGLISSFIPDLTKKKLDELHSRASVHRCFCRNVGYLRCSQLFIHSPGFTDVWWNLHDRKK